MKILHSADWHLDSPIQGRTDDQSALLKGVLLKLPQQVMAVAKAENCDMVILSGDLFDGPASPESVQALKNALEEISVPVCIAPGNHDPYTAASVWETQHWPAHVHIFTAQTVESVVFPELNCCVYGAAFTGSEAPGLLSGFRAETEQTHVIGLFHGDPTHAASVYGPVTAQEIQQSGLDYLALGHIHKRGELKVGETLCAWPGCPMGRGFDELDEKGVLIVTLEDEVKTTFLPLDTPRFYDWEIEAGGNPAEAIDKRLPAAGNTDFYRITLTGESEMLDVAGLVGQFSRFPNLILRDRTVAPVDLWASAGEDTLEGTYFRLLQEAMADGDEETCRRILLAAKISRQLLSGQEVKLP